jgi:hypothetical protein
MAGRRNDLLQRLPSRPCLPQFQAEPDHNIFDRVQEAEDELEAQVAFFAAIFDEIQHKIDQTIEGPRFESRYSARAFTDFRRKKINPFSKLPCGGFFICPLRRIDDFGQPAVKFPNPVHRLIVTVHGTR